MSERMFKAGAPQPERFVNEIEVAGVIVHVSESYKFYYIDGHPVGDSERESYRMGKIKKIEYTKHNAGNPPGYRIFFEKEGFQTDSDLEILSIGVASVERVEPITTEK